MSQLVSHSSIFIMLRWWRRLRWRRRCSPPRCLFVSFKLQRYTLLPSSLARMQHSTAHSIYPRALCLRRSYSKYGWAGASWLAALWLHRPLKYPRRTVTGSLIKAVPERGIHERNSVREKGHCTEKMLSQQYDLPNPVVCWLLRSPGTDGATHKGMDG